MRLKNLHLHVLAAKVYVSSPLRTFMMGFSIFPPDGFINFVCVRLVYLGHTFAMYYLASRSACHLAIILTPLH